ncbi:MAG: YbgC/FadM family acyl-CoA thioesterase [Holophagales bacterium]|jgi:acyl-CoA thioester hydrolase|nr:YbgC/FadM family acyl-CoA thioesterase [Holophagales bacterium]
MEIQIRVYYEDTDCGGVVYYANYLRWLERGRTEFLRERGIELVSLMRRDIWFSVSECNLKYKKSAKYDDLLRVVTELEEVGGAAFWLKNYIWRKNELLVEARVRIACMSGETGKVKRIPAEVVEAIMAGKVPTSK